MTRSLICSVILNVLKVTLKAFDDFKNKQKSVWSDVFWYVKVFVFWKCKQNTLRWDKMQVLKKFPSDTINGTKNALFFLLRAPTHHSVASNLRFLYELKHKVRLAKTMSRIFCFQFLFVFIEVYIFVQQNTSTLSLWSVVIPFKKIKKKSHAVLFPDLQFLSCNKKF